MIIDRLQLKMDVPTRLLERIEKIASTIYVELYEKGEIGLDRDIRALIDTLVIEDTSEDKSSLTWLCWTLCLACLPSIEWVKPDDPRPALVRSVYADWKLSQTKNADLWQQISVFDAETTGPQNFSEALLVLECQQNIYLEQQVPKIVANVLEAIDLCVQGYAIAAGSADRRPILNWLLNYVVPCAWHKKVPDELYTINTGI